MGWAGAAQIVKSTDVSRASEASQAFRAYSGVGGGNASGFLAAAIEADMPVQPRPKAETFKAGPSVRVCVCATP